VTPLEEIVLRESRFDFLDLAVERKYVDPKSRAYRFHVENLTGKKLTGDQVGESVEIPALSQLASRILQYPADRYGRKPVLRVLIQSRQDEKNWALPVDVILGYVQGSRSLQVLGWTRGAR
jgi:hypothetical protein